MMAAHETRHMSIAYQLTMSDRLDVLNKPPTCFVSSPAGVLQVRGSQARASPPLQLDRRPSSVLDLGGEPPVVGGVHPAAEKGGRGALHKEAVSGVGTSRTGHPGDRTLMAHLGASHV